MNTKRMMKHVLIFLIVIVVVVFGVVLFKKQSHVRGQDKLIKTANTGYADDARYINFAAGYVFAVPKSFFIDEVSIAGTQLIVPNGLSLKLDKVDQLYDAAVVVVQPISEIKANNNDSVKSYITKTFVPDLKKNVGPDVKVAFSMPGKDQIATIEVKKDGKKVRQIYIRGGVRPVMVSAKEVSDAYLETVNTVLAAKDSTYKDDVPATKKAVEDVLSALQKGEAQNVYDRGTEEFKKATTPAKLSDALKASSEFMSRSIIVVGGSILKDRYTSQVFYMDKTKEVGLGLVNLHKIDGQWKIDRVDLPTKKN